MSQSSLMSPLLWQSVPFKDNDAFLDFHGVHAAWHLALSSATKTFYALTDDLRQGGLERHGQMHDAVAAALGIPKAFDLVSYDLRDRDSFVGFMQSHALDHQRMRVAAGI